MAAFHKLLVKLVREEAGTETFEFATIAGLIVVSTITAIVLIGIKIATRWSSIKNSSL